MLLPGSGRIFSGSRIRTPLEKCDSPKSPQGYCCGVADLDFQISGGGGGLKCNFFAALRASVWTKYRGAPPLDPPLIRKENGFQEKDDRSSGYRLVAKKGRECGLRTPSSPPPPPPPLDPPLIGKENGFQEKDDRSSGYGFVVKKERVEEPPPPCFISSTFGIRKHYLIHPHQRQQKQQILY